jgi:threonine dehydrogenase-like Zn-dependent dehydrogenase
MKAIRVNLKSDSPGITLEEIQRPVLEHADEVLVRVLAIGLDGTDREILQEHYGSPPIGEQSLTTGHESLGIVVEAGAETGFQAGDLVTCLVRRPCHEQDCVNCRNGHADFCESGNYTERGIKGAHGFLAEYYKEQARYVVLVPKTSLHYGMLAEPQSIVEKVWNQVQKIQQRLIWEPKTALILGSGPLGLLGAATCRVLGLDVYVWSMAAEDSKQGQLAKACGAVYQQAEGDGSSGSKASLSEYVKKIDRSFDLILECTGYSPLAFEAMSVLGAGGVLALLGVTPGARKMEISADTLNLSIVLENKCIIGSVNASRRDFETGVYRLGEIEARFPGFLQRVITERFQLEEVHGIDFSKIEVKAIVEVVPRQEWERLAQGSSEIQYSFSV